MPLSAENELYVPCYYYIHSQKESGKHATDDSDDIDLFGDDAEDSAAALKQLSAAKQQQQQQQRKQKQPVVNKSMLVIEVKPNDAETDLNEIGNEIKQIQIEGLTWGENQKKVPLAFGLYKLQVQCVIVDDLVNTDTVIERIEEIGLSEENKIKKRKLLEENENDSEDEDELHGLVQSAQIVSFNKL
ncbi:elongation factor 1, putative [Eimeria tenella]|uniref:Elongation factor 1, putative n=1 Tax=Eimeria tenella TaxID=5802 RepID=U6KRK0_EIMTE|nr:elongation factor 1, putative [Eimeria tenella]CDJ38969.1 elongation factor 1, putative [Eimeria tenella]|eukprot:XP_013229724.1 elongation factor 1, putative [Eimeria tenella]